MPGRPKYIPNLLIISGTGNKSGKTTLACRIIENFSELSIIAVKITPHFHETTEGLTAISEGGGFAVYLETNRKSSKDTSRMLNSGAGKVYFAKVWDDKLVEAFEKIMENIPKDAPVICESPALRNFVEPGVFIIMNSVKIYNHKNISNLQTLPHVMLKLEELDKIISLPIGFKEGRWFYKEEV